MPKKFQGENTKSAAARARRAEAKAAADAKKQKELEDAYWKDEDKHVMRKEQRKVGARATPRRGRGRRGRAARRHWTWSTAGRERDWSRGKGLRRVPEEAGVWHV